MIKNKLILWEPCKGISKQILCLNKLIVDDDGISIILTDGPNNYIVRFEDDVYSFRYSQEQYLWKMRSDYGKWRDDNPRIDYVWSFFTIDNSDYKNWFKSENENLYTNIIESMIHYMIVTEFEIIEILNDTPPEVTIEKL